MTLPLSGAGPSSASAWTPASPTDGGESPHTWHYAGSDALYQESAKTTAADADGDAIGASENQGSDSHDLVQATAGQKPTLKLSILNGEPVFRFDGGDGLQAAYDGGAISQAFTIFAVAQLDAGVVNDNSHYYISDGDDATNRSILYKFGNLNPDGFAAYAGGRLTAGDADSDWHIWAVLFNGASSELWLDGTSKDTDHIGAQTPDGLTLGANNTFTYFWDGDIAEILVYGANLSDADKNQIGQYLADKYDLTWSEIT